MRKLYLIIGVILTSMLCFSNNSIAGEPFDGSRDKPNYGYAPVEKYDNNWSVEKYEDVLIPRQMELWKPGGNNESDQSKFFHEMSELGVQFVMSPGPRIIIKVAPSAPEVIGDPGEDKITAQQICDLASKYDGFSIKSMLIVSTTGEALITNCEMLKD